MERLTRLQDFEDRALKELPQEVADSFKYGAGAGNTTKSNADAYNKIRVIPRVLRNVSQRNASTTVLGEKVSMPVGISPTGAQRYAHPDGECANVRAAEAAKTVFILSSFANSTMEEVAGAAPGATRWFQMTILKNRDHTEYLVRKAELNGFKAIVLTVDDPIIPKSKWNGVIRKFSNFAVFEDLYAAKTPDEVDPVATVNEKFDDSLTWEDVTWLKSITKLPLVLKGVISPKDAVLAADYGASGVLVSNHGGRQYDGAPATIEILPRIVEAVGDRIEVYVDGGVRGGSDVFKALALGARMVFMGRPMLWGLACGGEAGARKVLDIMAREVDEMLAFTGCRNVGEITRDMIIHESQLWSA